MTTNEFNTQNMDCWMSLAAAIYESGRKRNDTQFLNSDWGKHLKEAVVGWAQLRINDRDNIKGRN